MCMFHPANHDLAHRPAAIVETDNHKAASCLSIYFHWTVHVSGSCWPCGKTRSGVHSLSHCKDSHALENSKTIDNIHWGKLPRAGWCWVHNQSLTKCTEGRATYRWGRLVAIFFSRSFATRQFYSCGNSPTWLSTTKPWPELIPFSAQSYAKTKTLPEP